LNYVQGLIEILGSILLALVFSRVKIIWGRTTVAAAVIAAMMLLIRHLPIVFGIHIAAGVLMIFLFIVWSTNANKSLVFLAVFASFFCLATIEFCLNQVFMYLNVLQIDDATRNSKIWLIMGYVQAVLMVVLALLLRMVLKPVNYWKSEVGKAKDNTLLS